MPNKLGEVVEQGCYKNDKRVGGAKFLHNCDKQQGNNVKWKFEVLNNAGTLIGHVEVTLKDSFKGDETAQKAEILKRAKAEIA